MDYEKLSSDRLGEPSEAIRKRVDGGPFDTSGLAGSEEIQTALDTCPFSTIRQRSTQ